MTEASEAVQWVNLTPRHIKTRTGDRRQHPQILASSSVCPPPVPEVAGSSQDRAVTYVLGVSRLHWLEA